MLPGEGSNPEQDALVHNFLYSGGKIIQTKVFCMAQINGAYVYLLLPPLPLAN